ncbi:MAG TPA: prolyl oligopeptidase family serine peptidase [Candidatus Angelobacter sp.]|jgi:dipeptidyl aminopeptidase/acylaminoacyl peptidase|nr:prolyl oligopeptidase family serine peptidase [Candidatus Angelobacter sp.]
MQPTASVFAKLRPAILLAAVIMPSLLFAQGAPATQPAVLKPGDNLVVENIPPVPAAIAEKANQYGEFRSAGLQDWHPTNREMLIGTRFADVPQIHMVKMPGGDRTQLTFFPDRTGGGHFGPKGDYFTFSKDVGGGEWFQIYRYDVANGKVTLLTDGKSRNTGRSFAHNDNRIAYSSTRRNGQDNDIYIMDPTDPKSDKLLLQVEGGGWGVASWSPDNKKLLVVNEVSANETYLWLVEAGTGEKKMLTPKSGEVQVAYSGGPFGKDGKGFYTPTDRDSEFHRLAYFDLATMKPSYLTSDIQWDVDAVDLSEDGKTLAFVTNEDGVGKLYLMNTATGKYRPVPGIPTGLIGGLNFHKNSHDLGFVLTSARSTADIYSVDVAINKLERWTSSETGGLNTANFAEPQLIKWPTFDGKTISGFLYMPDANKFPGKRPLMVNIHGGPEGQYRPGFLGRNNFYLNELGVALIFPNVRGSTGYGKTFLKLDNGVNRDHTHKDIGALLDWIGKNPALDSSKIMITGGSYGGYMTWAIAYEYNDKICCSLPIVGPSNLVTLLEHTEAYRRDLRRVEYGDERDPKVREYLEKTAPLNNSEKIRKPVYAVVGKNDPRVPWTESRQMLDKLKGNGIQTWFLMANDEGHGYAKKKNQDFLFYSTILFVQQFLLEDQKGTAGTQ